MGKRHPNFRSDLRFAARQLRSHPGFTIVGILTLALGIGASTAIFSAVNPILFKPLPYPHPEPDPDDLEHLSGRPVRSGLRHISRTRASAATPSTRMAIFEPWQPAMTGGSQPERLEGQSVSASFFRSLGVSPVLGRDFLASEDVFNGPKVVILSDNVLATAVPP